jgi:hypothetical protein
VGTFLKRCSFGTFLSLLTEKYTEKSTDKLKFSYSQKSSSQKDWVNASLARKSMAAA